MDTKVYIVGIGPGNEEYIIPEAVEIMNSSQIVIGFERAIESIYFVDNDKFIVESIEKILEYLNSGRYESISVAASGDPLFYGITEYIKKNFKGEIEVIPGVSSFQYMMAKLKKSWQGAFLGSLHGREEDFCEAVKKNKLSIWLTDKKHSPSCLANILENSNVEVIMYVGENLSYEDERIIKGYPSEIQGHNFADLTVVVVENIQD